jgi:hypothetical protein
MIKKSGNGRREAEAIPTSLAALLAQSATGPGSLWRSMLLTRERLIPPIG